jgi:hypothetical protein
MASTGDCPTDGFGSSAEARGIAAIGAQTIATANNAVIALGLGCTTVPLDEWFSTRSRIGDGLRYRCGTGAFQCPKSSMS